MPPTLMVATAASRRPNSKGLLPAARKSSSRPRRDASTPVRSGQCAVTPRALSSPQPPRIAAPKMSTLVQSPERRLQGELSAPLELDAATYDDQPLREAESRIVAVLQQQVEAQQQTIDAALQRVMQREEETIALVADRRNRLRSTLDRLVADVEAAARERDRLAAEIREARSEKEALEQTLRTAKHHDRARPSGTSHALAHPAAPKPPAWVTMGRMMSHSGPTLSSSSTAHLPSLQQRAADAEQLATKLRDACESLEATLGTRRAELEVARREVDDLTAELKSFGATEESLTLALRELREADKNAAVLRQHIPVLQSALHAAEAAAVKATDDDTWGISQLMEWATSDEAEQRQLRDAIDGLRKDADEVASPSATLISLATTLRHESDSLERFIKSFVVMFDAVRSERESEAQALRESLRSMEARLAEARSAH